MREVFWVFFRSFILSVYQTDQILAFIKLISFLRVSEEIEIKGLDIKKHGEPAYPTAAYGHGWDHEGDFRLSSQF